MSEETLYTEDGVHNDSIGETVQEGKTGSEGETRTDEEITKGSGEEAEREKNEPGVEEIVTEEPATEEETSQNEVSEKRKTEAEEADTEEIIDKGEGAEEMEEQEWNMTAEEGRPELEFAEEEPRKRGFFRRNREEANFLRDKWILSRIRDEDLMEYLILEQKRHEQLQKARDIREKRIISAFKLSVSLAAGVAVVYLLKDNPTIFVNILYIGGILGGFHFWKNSHEK